MHFRLQIPQIEKMTSILEGSEHPEGAPPTSGLLLESHLNLTCKRNLAFVYSAAAVFKVACEIKNSAIKKLTVSAPIDFFCPYEDCPISRGGPVSTIRLFTDVHRFCSFLTGTRQNTTEHDGTRRNMTEHDGT